MTTIKRIPPKSIYNQYEAQQRIQEQQNVVFEENKHQINTSLKSSVEQDSMNITNSISSEHQNNQVSEVKQEKKLRSTKNIYSMGNEAHGGVFKTFTDPSDDTKMVDVYRDGYRVEYDIINKTKRTFTRVKAKQLEDEMNKCEDEISLIRNKLGLNYK